LDGIHDLMPVKNMSAYFNKRNSVNLAVVLTTAVVSVAHQSAATPIPEAPIITYTYTGIGTGSLNGQSFVNASFTITAEALPSQILTPTANVFTVSDYSSTISIAGLGIASFTDQMLSVLNQNSSVSTLPAVGFSDVSKGVAVIFESNPTFETYNLGYSDPVTGANSVQLSPNNFFSTSKGNLTLTSVADAEFQANLAVPDAASSLALLSLSAASLFLWHRKLTARQSV